MYLTLGALTVELQSASTAVGAHLARLFSGWVQDHLPDGKSRADLYLELRLAQRVPDIPPAARLLYEDTQQLLEVYQPASGRFLLHFPGAALLEVCVERCSEVRNATGVVTAKAFAEGRLQDVLFASLSPLLRRRQYFLLHGFAASRAGTAILLVGPSASGKTTTGLKLLMAGWRLLANDVVLLESRPAGVYALPTPGRLNIRPGTFDLLPDLRRPSAERGGALSYHAPETHIWSEPTPISAVFFPTITRQKSCGLDRQPASIVLAQLLEQSVDRWDRPTLSDQIAVLHDLSRDAAGYRLRLGRDLSTLPDLLTPPHH